MQTKWIHQQGNTQLILYFSGWAMNAEAVAHLSQPPEQDLLIVWDYRQDELDFDFSPYTQIRLVAWSMGVWASDRFLSARSTALPIVEAVAFGGTGYPVDDQLGIPLAQVEASLSLLSTNRPRFDRMMCGAKSMRPLLSALQSRTTEEIYGEKERVYLLERDQPHPLPKSSALGRWTRVHIGEQDLVIPVDNQRRYWQAMGVEIVEHPDTAHYFFGSFASWLELFS